MIPILLTALLFGRVPDSIRIQLQEILRFGNRDSALSIAKRVLQEDNNPKDWQEMARILWSRGAREESYKLLSIGRKKLGNKHLFGRDFYLLYYRKRDYEKALMELVNILREEKRFDWVKREALRLKRYLGAEKSKRILEKLSKEKPTEPKIYYLLSDLYLQERDFKKAANYLHKAGEEKGLIPLAREALSAGENDIATEILDMVDKGDRNAEWFFLKGRVLCEKKEYRKAQQALLKASERGHRKAKEILLNVLLTKLRNPQEVLRLTQLDSINIFRVKALLSLGKEEEAMRLATLGQKKSPEFAFELAYLKILGSDLVGADSAFKAFIMHFPSSDMVNDALFYMEIVNLLSGPGGVDVIKIEKALAMNRPKEAEEKARAFLREYQAGPLSDYTRLLLAKALVQQGKDGEALGVLKGLKEGTEGFIVAKGLFEAYKLARDSIGDPEEAQDILETLILRFPDSPYADVARSLM